VTRYAFSILSGCFVFLVGCVPQTQVPTLQALRNSIPIPGSSPIFLETKPTPSPKPILSSLPPTPVSSPVSSSSPAQVIHSIRLSPSEITLIGIGTQFQLTVEVLNQAGQKMTLSPSSFVWSTDNPDVFEISKTGLLKTIKSQGQGQIIVRETSSGLEASMRVNIQQNNSGGTSPFGDSNPGVSQPVDVSPVIQHCSENKTCTASAFAGTGQTGAGGDFGAALGAEFNSPHGIFVDDGSVAYIADSFNHKIRQISSGGFVSTIAGIGTNGFNHEQGEATRVLLDFPNSIVGNHLQLYFSDKVNNRVRRLDLGSGTLVTVAGGGTQSDGVIATTSQLNFPLGLAKNNDKLYIADSLHHKIREVDLVSNIITTIAGIGSFGATGDGGVATSAALDTPHDLAFAPQGNQLYIADTFNHKIRKIDLQTKIISTVVGNGTAGYSGDGGSAISAQLNTPNGIAISALGHLYIADTQNKVIRMVHAQTGVITTIAGGGNGNGGFATEAKFEQPTDVFVDNTGAIYVVDALNNKISIIH
jgi:hypothetical protein